MKRNILKLFGIIALTALIGFSMAACSNDDDGDRFGLAGEGGNPFSGTTWYNTETGYTIALSFSSNTFSMAMAGFPFWSGTYTYNSNTATLVGYDGDRATATISGSRLTYTEEGYTIFFNR